MIGAGRVRWSALAFLASAHALADTPPTRWDFALDPEARARWQLHVATSEVLIGGGNPARWNAPVERMRALLEANHAESSPDVRLRFDLGGVYYALEMWDRCVAVLEPATREHPEHPAVIDALNALAYAYAHLDRSAEEIDAYSRYLELESLATARATALLNMAEAHMRMGNLREAAQGYRDAHALASTLPGASSTPTLATYGLAVALDRAGDVAGGAREAQAALAQDPMSQMIDRHNRGVFFVPDYERYWYMALISTERAKAASEARTVALFLRQAESLWSAYVSAAEKAPKPDRWLDLARARRERTTRERVAAERRAASGPRR